jgi:hypothetical protein
VHNNTDNAQRRTLRVRSVQGPSRRSRRPGVRFGERLLVVRARSLPPWREDYPRRIGLTIASVAADRDLHAAIADGARLAEEAPQREHEKGAAVAAVLKERNAQIRLENKAKFRPEEKQR